MIGARLALMACLITLAGCENAAQKAEREYDLVAKESYQPADKCAAARKAKDAWLKEGDQERYRFWSLIEYADCLPA